MVACNARDIAKESSTGFFISQAGFLLHCTFKITPCLCSLEQFELVIRSFSAGGKLAGAWLLATFQNVTPIFLWESKFSFHTHKLVCPVEILKHTFKYVAFISTASRKLCKNWHVLRNIKENLFFFYLPHPLPPQQDRLKQFPTPGTNGLDLSWGGMVTGQIEPCIMWEWVC